MDYKTNFDKLKAHYKQQLENKGFYVESDGDNALSISLTGLGLSTVYATLTEGEISYHLDSMDEEELNEILGAN